MRLIDIASILDAQLYGDKSIIITGIASINNAQTGQITFFKDYRFRQQLFSCRASAVILSASNLMFCRTTALVVQDPYLAYVKLVKSMHKPDQLKKIVASGAVIAPDAVLGKNIGIGANTVIESGVILDDDVCIGSGSFLGKNVKIGIGTQLLANVTVYHEVEIGKYCFIQSGSVIGAEGFGYIKDQNIWVKVPQLGTVKIGNYVEIGACTTIDRGTLDDTYIGDGVIIDNQCQIAHNVIIGEHTAIAGGVIIAGSVIFGKYCMIGGASVINGHIEICDKVTITGMGMVMRSITQPGIYSSGVPVQPNMVWRKTTALIMRIHSIYIRIKNIEKKIKKLIILLSLKL